MLNISSFLLFFLICFSLQDDHCFGIFQICPSKIEKNPKITGSIEHCMVYEDKDNCDACYYGYALSYDKKSCIPYLNCADLEKENKLCHECYPSFYFNGTACKKIDIDHCDFWDGTKCIQCAGYAYLDNGRCLIPTNKIDGCDYYDSNGVCNYCAAYYNKKEDGTCEFQGCQNENPVEYCGNCELGYELDKTDGKCKAYSEMVEGSYSKKNKVELALIILILALII